MRRTGDGLVLALDWGLKAGLAIAAAGFLATCGQATGLLGGSAWWGAGSLLGGTVLAFAVQLLAFFISPLPRDWDDDA